MIAQLGQSDYYFFMTDCKISGDFQHKLEHSQVKSYSI